MWRVWTGKETVLANARERKTRISETGMLVMSMFCFQEKLVALPDEVLQNNVIYVWVERNILLMENTLTCCGR